MGTCKRNSTAEVKQRKPLRAAKARISAPETTVRAQYRSAIGIDVHLNLLVCNFQTQLDDHREIRESREFYADRTSLDEFAQWCSEKKPEIILMESTGVLWYSPYEALEHVGFQNSQLALINARDAKAAAGRKTDYKDAARLSDLARAGHFSRSFVPPKAFRIQRLLARDIQKNKADLSRCINRYQKMLNSTGCRASTVFSDVRGKAANAILEAKISNAPNLEDIIKKNCRRLRATPEEIHSALNFVIDSAISEQLAAIRKKIAQLEGYDADAFSRLAELQKPYAKDIKFLMSISGIQERSARLIYAELGPNLLEYFPDSEHFCSWLGICSGSNTSAGRQSSGKCPKGNKWLRRTLIECANGLSLSKNFAGMDKFFAHKLVRGRRRAIVELAHFLARVIFSVLTHQKPYEERTTTAVRDVLVKRFNRVARQLSGRTDLVVQGDCLVEKATGAILAKISEFSPKPRSEPNVIEVIEPS